MTIRSLAPQLVVTMALLLAACGGSSGTTSHLNEDVSAPAHLGAVWVDDWSPVVRIDNQTYVGSGVVESLKEAMRSGEGFLSVKALHEDATVSHGYIRNGIGRDRLVQVLSYEAQGTYQADHQILSWSEMVYRFGDSPPAVKALVGTTDEQWRELRMAVWMINQALPNDWQLRVDDSRAISREPDEGEIVVAFTRGVGCSDSSWGCATPYYYDSGEITQGKVWIDSTRPDGLNERLGILVHEILHVLGREHPDPYVFPDTIMTAIGRDTSGFVLSQLDREALLAVYDRLDYGDRYIDFALGPWEDTSIVAGGVLAIPGGQVAFGAAEMNGHVQAWAHGPSPWGGPESNDTLFGTVRWAGRLLGLTPEAETVAGGADLSIRLATLDGQLDFTGLESWAPNAAPGAIGTGTLWHDGDLRYGIVVGGNQFWATSGDDGRVNGNFFGIAHEGMGGTVKRTDMVGAFGGLRGDLTP